MEPAKCAGWENGDPLYDGGMAGPAHAPLCPPSSERIISNSQIEFEI
jgi:hypothetical protein